MKKLLLAASLLLSPVAMAADSPTKLEYCTQLSELAEEAMRSRQLNVPMHKSINAVSNNTMAVALVKMAYSMPVMHSAKNKQIVINQFGSKVMVMCLEQVDI